MHRILFLLLSLSLVNNSCKKESDKKYCWQIIDHMGNKMGIVCNKTEAELLACARNGSCAISTSSGELAPCNYYKAEGEELCWLINNSYILKATETEMNHLRKCFNGNTTATKADCNYCQNWYSRENECINQTIHFHIPG